MSTPRDESVATEALSSTAADFRQQPDELIRAGELAAGLVDVVYSLRLEPDMEFEFVSPSVEAMVGYTPQEHYDDPQLGMRLLDPRDLDVLMGTVSAAIDEPISMRVRWTAKDGHSVWTDHRCVKRQRSDGSVVLHGAARDVTREHELAARYRLLAENSSDIVTCINGQGQLEWVSASVEHILGWKVEDLVGTIPWDIVHPDDHAAAADALTAAVDNPLERVSINLRIKSADGGWRWMSAVGHYAADGLLVTSYRDIEAEQRALTALRESEARYRLLVENATDVVYTVGPDRLVTWIAPTVTHTLGWTDSELIGTSMYDLSHEDDRARIDAILEAVFHGESIPNAGEGWPIRFRNKDGSYTWMALKTTTITDDDGQFSFAVTGMRDVDDLVKEERRLAEASARREAILASLLDPHVFLQAVRDDSGQIIDFIYTDANDAACVYNETPRELLIGKSLLELLPGQAGSGLLAMYAHAVESGEPLVLNDYAYPHDILLEERRFDIRAIRVGDGLSYTWRDVTERFEAARRVALSEESFRLLAEHSSDVVLRSRDGVMQWLSPSLTSALGWTPADWIGHRFEEFVHPDDLDLTHATRANINAGASAVTTSRLRDTGDEYHWVEIHGGPAFNSGGEPDGIVASFRVVDKEKRAQQVLAESEERFRLLAENSSDVVVRSREGLMLWVSPSLTAVLGWAPAEWVGEDLYTYIHPDDRTRLQDDSSRVAEGETVHARYRLRGQPGEYHWVGTSAGPYVDVNGRADGVISSFHLEDDQVEVEAELQRRATFDDLTGALKRDPAMERLNVIARLPRHPGLETAVLFIDVDEFKMVNDTWGHIAGDEMLKIFAKRIREIIRAEDTVARIGGDEFLVTLGGIHDLGEGSAIAEEIRVSCAEPVAISGGIVTATLSIGVTIADPVESGDDLIARADKAMYAAKRAGRNRVVAVPLRSERRAPDPYE